MDATSYQLPDEAASDLLPDAASPDTASRQLPDAASYQSPDAALPYAASYRLPDDAWEELPLRKSGAMKALRLR